MKDDKPSGIEGRLPEGAEKVDFGDKSFLEINKREGRTGNISMMQEHIMPVVALINGQYIVMGTCFSVTNDGLCVTARHVIDEIFPILQHMQGQHHELDDPNRNVGALYISYRPHPDPEGDLLGGIIQVRHIYVHRLLDIALIKLAVPYDTVSGKSLPMPVSPLSLRAPAVGEYFFGFGYPETRVEQTGAETVFHDSLSATRGEVLETFFPKVDSVMMPFPCFRTNARFDRGMSGGPLIGQNGRVIGVICSAIHGIDDGTYVSFASMIASAFSINLDGINPTGVVTKRFLWDFVTDGVVPGHLDGAQVSRSATDIVIDLGDGRIFRNTLDA